MPSQRQTNHVLKERLVPKLPSFMTLGFICPVILLAKHLYQRLCLIKFKWDNTPGQKICDIWNRFRLELPLLRNRQIKRHILSKDTSQVELHKYCDVSQSVYDAVIYLRLEHTTGNVTTCSVLNPKSHPLRRYHFLDLNYLVPYLFKR